MCEVTRQIREFVETNCRGAARAVRATIIAGRFGISIREVADAIRQMRDEGIVIGSSKGDPAGYYIPVTPEELDHHDRSYRAEMYAMLHTYNVQKRAVRRMKDGIRQHQFTVSVTGQLAFMSAGKL